MLQFKGAFQVDFARVRELDEFSDLGQNLRDKELTSGETSSLGPIISLHTCTSKARASQK